MKKIYYLLIVLMALNVSVSGQDNSDDLFDLSLEELMNIEIVSASKKAESLFDAPVSSYIITNEEILNSGATSVPDALKLCPDVIVREHTNGVYDVHLRGLDNISRYGSSASHLNKVTLVMIDDRPIFNHVNGGVFWEALPVGIHDIERIEIVKGPSAPLFGPNAVTGAINIVTKNVEKAGFHANGNIQYGSFNSLVGGVSAGIKAGKFSALLSGNIDQRDRYTNQYYEYAGDRFVDTPAELTDAFGRSISDPEVEFPYPSKAVDRYGFNAFLNYEISEGINIGLDAGLQDTERQAYLTSGTGSFTPFSFGSFKSEYINLTSKIKDLKVRYSYTNGDDQLSYSAAGSGAATYSYVVNEVFIDYTWNISDKLSLQPGFNYQNADYSNYDPVETIAGSLRLDYLPLENWRLIAAVRADKFSVPEDAYLSYQFASTYKINENNLVRAVVSRSNSGAFLGPLLLDINVEFPIPGYPFTGYINFEGTPDLKLFTLDLFEVGYRSRLSENLELNIDLYRQIGKDFFAQVNHEIPPGYFPLASLNVYYENLQTVANQTGVSLSMNYVASSNFQVKPFFTYQKTDVKDMPSGLNVPEVDDENNLENTVDEEHKNTPNFYGGLYLNWTPIEKLNVNINPYFMSSYKIYHSNDLASDTTIGAIDGTFLLNAKVSYQVFDELRIYANVRNLFSGDQPQFYGTDTVKPMVLGGVSFNF